VKTQCQPKLKDSVNPYLDVGFDSNECSASRLQAAVLDAGLDQEQRTFWHCAIAADGSAKLSSVIDPH
jgi:hypothetical protein